MDIQIKLKVLQLIWSAAFMNRMQQGAIFGVSLIQFQYHTCERRELNIENEELPMYLKYMHLYYPIMVTSYSTKLISRKVGKKHISKSGYIQIHTSRK
jgi:hypothetical protein